MTIEQANAYFASLPEGFAPARQLQEALSAKAGRVDYLGVAGTAGKTTAAALTAAVLRAAGLVTGSYHARGMGSLWHRSCLHRPPRP